MYVPSRSRKYVCRNCRRKIPVRDLDSLFGQEFDELKLPGASAADAAVVAGNSNGELLAAMRAELEALKSEYSNRVAALESRISQLESAPTAAVRQERMIRRGVDRCRRARITP